MTPTWDNYTPHIPTTGKPHHQMTAAEARESFEEFMNARQERWEGIRTLMMQDGLELENSNAGIQMLQDWLCENVERKPFERERLTNLSYSLIFDVSVILGDTAIMRSPNLSWVFWNKPPKTDIAYQKPVLFGFTNVANKKYHVDPDRLVATLAYRHVDGLPVSATLLVDILTELHQKA